MSNVRRVQQISVFLENRPGQMALLCSSLAEAGVSILALSVADTIEHGLVRLVVDHPDSACHSIEAEGFNCLKTDVLQVVLPEHQGAIARLTHVLASAGVNIQYFYGSLTPGFGSGCLYLRVLDLDSAEEVLIESDL